MSLSELLAEHFTATAFGQPMWSGVPHDAAEAALEVIAANPEAVLAFLCEQGKVEQDKRPGLFGCPNVSDQSALCTCRPVYVLKDSELSTKEGE